MSQNISWLFIVKDMQEQPGKRAPYFKTCVPRRAEAITISLKFHRYLYDVRRFRGDKNIDGIVRRAPTFAYAINKLATSALS